MGDVADFRDDVEDLLAEPMDRRCAGFGRRRLRSRWATAIARSLLNKCQEAAAGPAPPRTIAAGDARTLSRPHRRPLAWVILGFMADLARPTASADSVLKGDGMRPKFLNLAATK